MSYLSPQTSKTEWGVTKVGGNIDVTEGVISLEQSVAPNANVVFAGANVSNLRADGNLVVTSITPTAGAGISLANVISNGYSASFTVTNTGVLSLVAGNGISISNTTGNITISSFGADLINVIGVTGNYTLLPTDEYVGVASNVNCTITLPTSADGRLYYIKDELGLGSVKITLVPQSGQRINGANSFVINVPYQSVSVVGRAGNWWTV